MIIQLTTINGMNTPSDVYIAGVNASITISTIVTNVAMMIINIGRRTDGGIIVRSAETNRFAKISTNAAPAAIPIPFSTVVVTASNGQRPNTSPNIGLSFPIPRMNSLNTLLMNITYTILLSSSICPFNPDITAFDEIVAPEMASILPPLLDSCKSAIATFVN